MLRSCYTADMQMDVAGDIIARVQWYFVPPGTPFLPTPHQFGSSQWATIPRQNVGLGELWDSDFGWANGAPPFPYVNAGKFCGPPDWWANGAPSDTPPLVRDFRGLPLCCSVPIVSSSAGGPRIGAVQLSCQPWHVFGPPAGRQFIRKSTGEVWTTATNTTTSYSAHGVAFTSDLVQLGAVGRCRSFSGTTCQITTHVGVVVTTYQLSLVTWNPLSNRGLWRMPVGANRYSGEYFAWVNPV